MRIVIESLRRWEAKLQGTPPASFRLWNSKGNIHWPKDERALSDEVAIHLKDDLQDRGVVANREVVIRHGEKPGGRGERTDILIQAMSTPTVGTTREVITLTIEVKGCWNAGLKTDMESQLRDRYLLENECCHGLYLIGWFNCPQWDAGDKRRSSSPQVSVDALQKTFCEQAKILSTEGVYLGAIVVNAALR